MNTIPKKLTNDAIVDAVCELRFDCAENRDAPEVVVGMLSSNPRWRELQKRRLPEADIPAQIRSSNPDLRHRPVLELTSGDGFRKVRIGSHSISTSRTTSYPGWEIMREDISELAEWLFSTLEDISVFRSGLRYINVLEPKSHKMQSIHELRFKIMVDDTPLDGEVNLNFSQGNERIKSTVRIASPDFVSNMAPENGIGVVDIDTIALSPNALTSKELVESWCEEAHAFEKEIFFGLFSKDILEEIVEEWE